MLPDADIDAQQLAMPATLSPFKPVTNLDYHVHNALAANLYS